MPGDPSDNSTIGEGLSEPAPTTTSIKSLHSAGDSITEHYDGWLQGADFYHGYIPREDIPPLLLKHGDYLVRLSEANVKTGKKKKKRTISRVISVLTDPESKNELIPLEKRASLIRNIVIMHRNKKWWIDPAVQFDNLQSLFQNYSTKPILVEKESIILKRGVGLCRWEFRHSNVQVGRLLGRGAYGEVRKGTVIRKNGQIVNVAVKTLTMTNLLTRELIREIMKEARIMRDLHHTNVVSMIGVVLVDHPLYILLEYVSGGALDVYLKRKHSKISKEERLAMILGVAAGMDYIHKANVIHRDLAARNCLYDRSNTVKISDFGLSRPGTIYKMKTAQKMPIKWMAPESIKTFTFTQKTDIYTFGVLIYEIFAAVGPYEDMRNSVVKKMIVEGQLNKFPSSTPDYVVTFVNEKLWCKDPDKRPDFGSIIVQLEKLITTYTLARTEKAEPIEEPSSGATIEGKTTTIDLDVGESKSPSKSKKADVKPVPKLVTPEDMTPSKVAAVGTNKDKTVKSVKEPPKTTTATPSAILKPTSELMKPTQIDVDSRRDREEFNVEIRTKPVFGRRSKFSDLKKKK